MKLIAAILAFVVSAQASYPAPLLLLKEAHPIEYSSSNYGYDYALPVHVPAPHVEEIVEYSAPTVIEHEAAPLIKTVHAAPIVEAYHAAPVHAQPLAFAKSSYGYDYSVPATVPAPHVEHLVEYAAPRVIEHEAAPLIKTVHAAPVVEAYHAAPVVEAYHAAPVVEAFHAEPLAFSKSAFGYDYSVPAALPAPHVEHVVEHSAPTYLEHVQRHAIAEPHFENVVLSKTAEHVALPHSSYGLPY